VEEEVVDVGPELLEGKDAGVDADVQAPLAERVAHGAFARRVVEVRDTGRHAGAEHFTGVEDLLAGVRTRDDDAADGVLRALDEAAMAERVVTRVLMGNSGHDELDEVVFAGLVDGGMPEVAAVTDAPFAELGVLVAALVIERDDGGEDDRRVVERVFAGGDELLLDRLGRQLGAGADRAKVGDNAKDALGLAVGMLVRFVGSGARPLGLHSSLRRRCIGQSRCRKRRFGCEKAIARRCRCKLLCRELRGARKGERK
jgi:hypothetical protein